jgi:hypothetical protein
MLGLLRPIAKTGAFVFAAFLAVSPAIAQPSPLGHVAAPGSRSSSLRIYPGDKGYHSTMQIEHYYQTRGRLASSTPSVRVTPQRYRATSAPTALNVVVSIGEPALKPVMVDIRGPDGKVRSFAVAQGNDVIQPRRVIVRAGEKLIIRLDGARVQLPKTP